MAAKQHAMNEKRHAGSMRRRRQRLGFCPTESATSANGEPGMAKKYTARSGCGAATFEFSKDPEFIANCHCLDCKKASGGEMATWFAVPEDDFTLLSGAPKAFHYVADSGKGLERNFCPTCGARLYTSNL